MASNQAKDASRESLAQVYHDALDILHRYWVAYGGIREIIRSPYVHVSVLITALTNQFWRTEPWFNTSISVLPNLLGFSVAGFAVWIGWGDERFRKMLIETGASDTEPSITGYEQISATFAHFAIVQTLALFFAITASALAFELSTNSVLARTLSLLGLDRHFFAEFTPLTSAVGFFLLVYAVICTLEAILALFRLSTWFVKLNKEDAN